MAYTKTIHTTRLTLRPPRRGDEADLFAIHSDPLVMRYFSEPPWLDPERAARQIDDDAGRFEREESFRFAIVLADTGRQIGNCTLFALHRQNRRAEVGYALAQQYWGHGYMAEAMRALLAFAFTELDLHRLEADIDPRNLASATLLTRLGFAREGLLRERWIVADEVSDSALYGLLRREWKALLPRDHTRGQV
jgi:ribosomal-protein-alanine N-acetyltransferase